MEEATVSMELDPALQSRLQKQIVLHSSPTRELELLSEAEVIVLMTLRGNIQLIVNNMHVNQILTKLIFDYWYDHLIC